MSLIVTNSFYRFVESANAPSTDPLILWLNGGKFTLLLDPNFLNRYKNLRSRMLQFGWLVICK
jgi:hypothetical protein